MRRRLSETVYSDSKFIMSSPRPSTGSENDSPNLEPKAVSKPLSPLDLGTKQPGQTSPNFKGSLSPTSETCRDLPTSPAVTIDGGEELRDLNDRDMMPDTCIDLKEQKDVEEVHDEENGKCPLHLNSH
jgi:hypothetical protein